MGKFFLLLVMVVLTFQTSEAQCLPGDIFLINQAQVDYFATECPDESVIYGSLVIGDTLSDITNLEGLSGLKEIQGAMSIQKNEFLDNISGLQGIEKIDGSISILANKKLKNIINFPLLKEVKEDLFIVNNPSLKSIDGFENIGSIAGDIILLGNDSLQDVKGLSGISKVSGSIRIHDNNSLVNLTGLDSIMTIGEDLTINYNDSLESFEGLLKLHNIGRDLVITFNPFLHDLDALHGLNSIGRDLYIDSNEKLEDCVELCDLLNLHEIGGDVSIGGNAAGCSTTDVFVPICAQLVALNSVRVDAVQISPNPAHSYISIELPDNQSVLSVQMVSLAGKSLPLVLRQNYELDVSNLGQGVYFLLVRTDARLYRQKVVVF